MSIARVKLSEECWANLILLEKNRSIYPEGSFLKFLDPEDSKVYREYVDRAVKADKKKRESRLEVTKQVQEQNTELIRVQELLQKKQSSLKEALEASKRSCAEMEEAKKKEEEAKKQADAARLDAEEQKRKAESAKAEVEKDLDYMQKRTQFELIGNIVKVALGIVVSVGALTTCMYAWALFAAETEPSNITLLANTWSNMFGILLTNSFSIIGTIMGVKYATDGRVGEKP